MQIRLSKPSSEVGASIKHAPADSVTVACPDHLVLADLPVAKSLGSASANATVKIVGRRSRRQLGERVHFCVRCDFPIAIYGRLSPCEHAFCLDCARSDSLCYLCDERIQKIQTIKMMEGIYICAAPHCLKSFLKRTEFESHINEIHADLLHPGKEKEGNETEAISIRKSSISDSTVLAPPRQVFSPNPNTQVHDREDKMQRPLSRDPPPTRPVIQSRPMPMPMPPYSGPSYPSEQHPDGNQPHIYDRAALQIQFPHQNFDPPRGSSDLRQDSVHTNSVIAPQFGYGPYASDGTQQYFGAPYEIGRQDPTPEAGPGKGQGQGSVLGFQPGPTGSMNYSQNYPQPWNMVPGSVPLEPPMVPKGTSDGFTKLDPQGRGFFQGNYGQNVGTMPSNNAAAEQRQGGNFVDAAAKGLLSSRPSHLPPPPLGPSHLPQIQRGGRPYFGDGSHEPPPGFGWQSDSRDGDSYGGAQD
ncbi:E3 ubiquitin-protein ligase HAKAI homolog [Andrographis paniculata]|uniref:E3 ubiquitin-protein ligase HAKAI homolog n=1 Tax=Andrographis paniculata TaxID=175694 RepID=UPI0021E74361|nr:E3 ubiquitin-protein ligase HAKAI homolog [Andrographis paniculata]